MRLSRRVAAGLMAAVGFLLASVVLYDIYADWIPEGKPLWSTLAENSVPLLLALSIPVAAWRLATSDRSREYVASVSRWTLLGFATMLFVAGSVVGLELLQGELKPRIIVLQVTIVGTIAGLLVGRNTARVEQTRDQVERQKEQFESLFANSPSAIADLSFEGDDPVIEDVNDRFRELFDYGETEAGGDLLFEVVSPESSETRTEIHDHVQRDELYTTETAQFTTGGGRYFNLRVVPYSDGERAYAVYQDITDLKESQRELETTVNRLETSNEQLQQFAYVASHDLQEPIRMVSSYVDLLADEYRGEFDEEADEYIEYAVSGAERMQEMINDLLQYSRVRTQAEAFSETDPEEVLEQTLVDLDLLVDETDATVTYDDLPTVEADASQLGQVFQNLVENAIDHAGEDPPEIHVTAEKDKAEAEVVFAVEDNGPGIPDRQQERIFEIFEQGRREDEGTGIGLAICRRIVNRHGGEMWVESTEGEGATFYFSIPIEASQQSTTLGPQVQ